MRNNVFERLYAVLNNNRKKAVLAVVAVLLFSIFRLLTVPLDNNVELMLPRDAEFSSSLKFLRESSFSDKIVLSLRLKGEAGGLKELVGAADQLKRGLQPPLVEQVESGIVEGDVLDDIRDFMGYVPQLVTEQDLSEVKREMTASRVKAKLRAGYKQMLSPNTLFVSYFIQNDPLNIKTRYLQKIRALVESTGYRAQFKEGHFVSLDEKHAMLIIKTPVLITDSAGARKLIAYIKEQIALLPDNVEVDMIGGHLHTLSNEDIIRKDISKTVIAISVILLSLLVIVLRSGRALLVFLIPVVAIVIAMNLTLYLIGALSSFVVGFAAVIAGITVDYGIHVYLAMQAGGLNKVKEIVRPVLVGVLTTMGVLASFFFSSINGYKQFALLTNLSIVISIFFYLFFLPKFFCENTPKRLVNKPGRKALCRVIDDRLVILFWVVLVGFLAFCSRGLGFDNDIRVYDGSSDDIFSVEERFHDTWGAENELAMFVVGGEDREKVLRINEQASQRIKTSFGDEAFASMAEVFPALETRRNNVSRWESFWKNGREKDLRTLLREQGAEFGYSQEAFDPFFETLYTSAVDDEGDKAPKFIERVQQRFLQDTGSGYYAITYFADSQPLVDKAREISRGIADTFIISRNNMARSISLSVYQEVKKLAWIAGFLIVFLTAALLRNLRLTILSLLPVVTSVLAILGCFGLLGFAINAPALIAILVVVGLCIDYGVFMVYDCRHKMEAGTLLAVTLSAVTTIAGGGVLLIATHPVLFYVGMTMAVGIFTGYIAAVLVIPAGYRLWIAP